MNYQDKEFGTIKIIISRRKSIAVGVDRESGTVFIKSHSLLTEKMVAQLLDDYRLWLRKVCQKINRINESRHNFEADDKFFYLGKLYGWEFGSVYTFDGEKFIIPYSKSKDEIRENFRLLYRHLAKNYLQKALDGVSNTFQIPYKLMKITNASTRWGSCLTSGSINFPWNLIMCEPEIINYVICHELAHRKQMNHSALFWREVEKMCPNYRVFRKILKDNSVKYSNF